MAATSEEPNWEGLPDTTEHRTAGPHRAWSYADAEWCYPSSLCWTCDQSQVPDRWKGDHVGDVLSDLRARVREQQDKYDSSEVDYRAALTWVLDLMNGDGDE